MVDIGSYKLQNVMW